MTDPIEDILSRKLVLVTGKGGIGKTVVSTALAQLAALAGKRVCLIESAAFDQVAPLFGRPAAGHTVTLFQENLWVVNLNASDTFKDFIVKYLGLEALFDRVFNHALVRSLLAMLPALGEITLLGRLFYACEIAKDPAFDLVVFDGFASGHFYNLLTTPAAVLNSGLVGPVIKETQRMVTFMGDAERCAAVLVANPEPLVVSETLDFLGKLRALEWVHTQAIVLNRYLPPENAASVHDDAAQQYCAAKLQTVEASLAKLRRGLSKVDPIDVIPVLDRGTIAEPISATFAKDFFEGAHVPL